MLEKILEQSHENLPNIESGKINYWENVVSTDDHAQVGDADVLETAYNSGGESGVVLSAQDDRVWEHKSHHAGEKELNEKQRVRPLIVIERHLQLSGLVGKEECWH